MSDESANRPAARTPGGGRAGGGAGEQSPLQARAAFIQNWSWDAVVRLNRGACERGGAQHGFNSETQAGTGREWEKNRAQVFSFQETLDFFRWCHKQAPFLFFNGNTFAELARQMSTALLADLPPVRRREAASAVAHYVAGVLDREAMEQMINTLCAAADLKPGDRVQTLRGSTRGQDLRVLDDGRLVWRPDGSEASLTCLPEALKRAQAAV
jgi:hypothetical protein